MPQISSYKIIILALVLIGVASFLYLEKAPRLELLSGAEMEKGAVVELRNDGFYPIKITIPRGGTVTFTNVSGAPMWPASDPHPIHTNEPGLDPKEFIAPGKSWRYTFNQPGTWHYHDHLSVSLRGTIVVLDENRKELGYESERECESADETQTLACFDTKIRSAVAHQGIDAAFALFTELYESGKAPAGCHWTGHLIGEEGARQFLAGKKFAVTTATSYCGYAFYHGFMETLLRQDPSPKRALAFCEYVADELGEQGRDNCYHGIGHGFTEEEPDSKKWGDAEVMLHPGLDVCERLFGSTLNKWEICATGVYTVVATWASQNKYGLILDKNDPFTFCRMQPRRYDRACYGEFAPKLDTITNWDVSKLTYFIKDIEDKTLQELIVRTAVGPMMQREIVKDDLSSYIYGCRTLPGGLPTVCLRGVAWGLVAHGEPQKEYRAALKFCASQALTPSEREECYDETFSQLRRIYPPEQVGALCKNIAERYQYVCFGNS